MYVARRHSPGLKSLIPQGMTLCPRVAHAQDFYSPERPRCCQLNKPIVVPALSPAAPARPLPAPCPAPQMGARQYLQADPVQARLLLIQTAVTVTHTHTLEPTDSYSRDSDTRTRGRVLRAAGALRKCTAALRPAARSRYGVRVRVARTALCVRACVSVCARMCVC